jgi:hypothetical protein
VVQVLFLAQPKAKRAMNNEGKKIFFMCVYFKW